MCAMLLADLGATVLRIDRKQPVDLGTPRPLEYNLLLRNRHSIALDLALGILAAISETRGSGKGQVIDAAIVDGTASLMMSTFGLYAAGLASLERGTNQTDSGAYFYDVYECADGRWISIAAIEAR